MNQLKVSIITITYNQAKYIRKTLDGILMQKVSFNYEVIIHDDASTDGTTAIIREYEEKYPAIIKPIYSKKNRFSTGNYDFIAEQFERSRGAYIAMCEGDDYWTDADKLQVQVDYMERRPSVSVCFHPVEVVYDDGRATTIFPEHNNLKEFTKTNLFRYNYMQTNSVMYRRSDYKNMHLNFLPIDWYLHIYHARNGRVGFIDKVMSVYRVHDGGIWSESSKDKDLFWHHQWRNHYLFYEAILNLAGSPRQREIIAHSRYGIFKNLLRINSKKKYGDTLEIVKYFPSLCTNFLDRLYEELTKLELDAELLNEQLQSSRKIIQEKDNSIKELQLELHRITSSKSWKITKPLRAILSIKNTK